MPDWADETAKQLLEIHAIMRGDKFVVLQDTFPAAIATRLRVAKAVGGVEAIEGAQQAVREVFGRAS